MAIDTYDLDPDVIAISRKNAREQIPTNKSSMSGKNPQLQAEEEYNYDTDPDVLALSSKKVVTPEEKEKLTGGFLPSWLKGGGEAALHTIASGISIPASILAGIYGSLTSGKFGTQEGIRAGEAVAKRVQEKMQSAGTQPTTEEGKSILEGLQSAFEASKAPPIFPEGLGLRGERALAGIAGQGAKAQLQAQFGGLKPKISIERAPSGLQSGGAMAASNPVIAKANIDSALAEASPQLQEHVKDQPPENVNLHALETRALEEKHGINLIKSQRLDDTAGYASAWNKRGTVKELGEHFGEQPVELSNAFEKSKLRHAPNIPSTADASELGQHEINALAEKDKIRNDAIKQAYRDLTDANGGNFPIDIGKVKENINTELSRNVKSRYLSSELKGDLEDFYKNPTFENFEFIRSNLADEMRTASNGKARQAAYIARSELEKMPVFGEEGGSPQAQQLKQLADKARSLYAERQRVIESNPAYKAAVKEASSLEDVSQQGESLNAAKFHNKFVSSATPEAIRRMKSEIPADHIANEAMAFAELERAKNSIANPNATRIKADTFANFMRKNAPVLKEALPPEAMKDVLEIGLLSSKMAKPEAGVFNYSNSYSALISDLMKQGMSSGIEGKLAAATKGASIVPVGIAKKVMQKVNEGQYTKEELHPLSGILNKE